MSKFLNIYAPSERPMIAAWHDSRAIADQQAAARIAEGAKRRAVMELAEDGSLTTHDLQEQPA